MALKGIFMFYCIVIVTRPFVNVICLLSKFYSFFRGASVSKLVLVKDDGQVLCSLEGPATNYLVIYIYYYAIYIILSRFKYAI